MLKFLISTIILFINTNSISQNFDYEKVKSIGSVLCECLDINKSKDDRARIEECTSVLLDGLSVIKNNELRKKYAQKSDSYLQRNCLEYAKLIFKNVPNSDIELVNEQVYDKYQTLSITEIRGKYSYTDFLGDTFEVNISPYSWEEKIVSTDKLIKFSFNRVKTSLIFEDTNDSFFKDFYIKGEELKIRFNTNREDQLQIILDIGNGIYLKKILTKI